MTPGANLDGDTITLSLTANGQQTQRFTFKRVDDPTVAMADTMTADPADRVVGSPAARLGLRVGHADRDRRLGDRGGRAGRHVPGDPGLGTLRVTRTPRSARAACRTAARIRPRPRSRAAGPRALAMFTEAGRPYSDQITGDGAQRLGLAGRIDVNAMLMADPSRLVVMSLSAAHARRRSDPPGLPARRADLGRPFLHARRRHRHDDRAVRGGGRRLSARVIGSAGGEATNARQIAEGQELVVTS